jgi:hypothetical protein
VSLVVTYRYAVRPILIRHHIIPLQHLPSTISQHFENRRRRGHIRLPSEDFDEDPREYRDEEEGAVAAAAAETDGGYRDHNDNGFPQESVRPTM